ncbi:MAG: nicotinate (nicotinamide) nucleotide adenylyltransferase [Thermodesulfobacteriota bacterium]
MSGSRTGLYGGSFNPVHFGHLRAAEEVRERAGLDEVWLLPASTPPHKDAVGVAPAEDRLRMLELALAGASGLRAEPIELERSGPSYTIDTVRALKTRHPRREFAVIVGLDAFRDFHTWHRHDEIPAECDLIVTSRPPHDVAQGPDALRIASPQIAAEGAFCYVSDIGSFRHQSGHRLEFVPVTAIDVSASALRAAVAAGRSIRFLTPDAVVEYIAAHGLYGASRTA